MCIRDRDSTVPYMVRQQTGSFVSVIVSSSRTTRHNTLGVGFILQTIILQNFCEWKRLSIDFDSNIIKAFQELLSASLSRNLAYVKSNIFILSESITLLEMWFFSCVMD